MNNGSKLSLYLSAAAILTLSACGQADTVATTVSDTTTVAGDGAVAAAKNAVGDELTFSAASVDKPNVIFMIGDDMGQETLSCFNIGNAQAHTPNLDKLCASGIRFDNFWSQPVCSPTRATLLSGQYGFKNGIGAPLGPTPNIDWKIPGGPVDDNPAGARGGNAGMAGNGAMARNGAMAGNAGMGAAQLGGVKPDWKMSAEAPFPVAPSVNTSAGLNPDIHTFVEALSSDDDRGYTTAAVGKWHLAGTDNGSMSHPNNVGFDHYTGPMRGGGVAYYDRWSKSTDGSAPFGEEGYVTSDTVNDGIRWIDSVEGKEPFFMWVAFNAPHTPFHMPPKELLSSDLKNLTADNSTPLQQYNAMIEAMDTEIGRLIASLEPDTMAKTYIAFMGDNGTPGQANQQEPYGRTKSKGSLFQGGVNVPLFIAGPGIKPGSATKSLANSVDIFDTVLELTGVNDPKADEAVHSVSLAPILLQDTNAEVRDFVFADVFGVSGRTKKNQRAISNGQYKLIEDEMNDTAQLYNLKSDPFENNNLLTGNLSAEAKSNLEALRADLSKLVKAD